MICLRRVYGYHFELVYDFETPRSGTILFYSVCRIPDACITTLVILILFQPTIHRAHFWVLNFSTHIGGTNLKIIGSECSLCVLSNMTFGFYNKYLVQITKTGGKRMPVSTSNAQFSATFAIKFQIGTKVTLSYTEHHPLRCFFLVQSQ